MSSGCLKRSHEILPSLWAGVSYRTVGNFARKMQKILRSVNLGPAGLASLSGCLDLFTKRDGNLSSQLFVPVWRGK